MAPVQSALVNRLIPADNPALRNTLYGGSLFLLLTSLLIPQLVPARYSLPSPTAYLRSLSSKSSSSKTGFEEWIKSEREYAWRKLLDNISRVGTDKGTIVASPSKKDPDYYYGWSRDDSCTMKIVISHYIHASYGLRARGNKTGEFERKMCERVILDFITETKKKQRMETPSGGFKTGGLGEVKFNVDGTPFTGSWGRPQNDGPALRASTLIGFAKHVLDANPKEWDSFIRRELYDGKSYEETESVIKADLDYVCKVWEDQCFDLWEEVKGVHHFNMLITIRALLDGAEFATRLGDPDSATHYRETAQSIVDSLGQFWKADEGYLLASVNVVNDHGKIRWLDTGTVLGFNHAGSTKLQTFGEAGVSKGAETQKEHTEDDAQYLGSDKSLATQFEIAESMYDEYALNKKHYKRYPKGDSRAWAVGRYYEDVYDGDGKRKTGKANPWHLCTLAHAEFLYRLVPYFADRSITITATSAKFWASLPYFRAGTSPSSLVGKVFKAGSSEHSALLASLREKGDGFVSVVRRWARWNGGLWEQFDREDGQPMGAPDLTWSYASFLSAIAARDGQPMYA